MEQIIKKQLILFLLFLHGFHSFGCTMVAVSGSVTEDGRPLLFINRDQSYTNYTIKIVQSELYTYLAQCFSSSNDPVYGFNETGFAIMNTHSYNLPNAGSSWNGYIIKLALKQCRSVDDFAQLLDSQTKPMPVRANYGVMDADGHIAVFETGANGYVKYNVDDSSNGYLIRTNHSFSGDATYLSDHYESITSVPRYYIATDYLASVFSNCNLRKEHLLELSRYLVDNDGTNLYALAPVDEEIETFVDFKFYIPRYLTTSAMVIQGVNIGESPLHTTAWTMVGPPLASVIIPLLISPNKSLPRIANESINGNSWLSIQGNKLKNRFFRDSQTIDLAKLYNCCGTGIMQIICSIEREILERGNELVYNIREDESAFDDLPAFYSWVDAYVKTQYDIEFNGSTEIIPMAESLPQLGRVVVTYDILGRIVRKTPHQTVIVKNNKKVIKGNK